ncbi:MAG: cyd operon protein YbgT, partial [Brevundimonas sp.]
CTEPEEHQAMWYFSWILGVGLAVGFGVLNGLWHEFHLFDEGDQGLSVDAAKEGDVPL